MTGEKKTEVAYSPLSEDGSSSSTGLEDLSPRWYSKNSLSARPARPWLLYGAAAVLYSILLVTATLIFSAQRWQALLLHGATVVDTPLRPAIQYEATKFQRGWKANYTLMGQPSPELDAAWDDILQYYYSEIPYSYMEKLGRLEEGIPLENGNYIATYGVMHQMHCLKRVHHAFYPDYYFSDMDENERAGELKHVFHCLQSLLELTMCKGDESPLTMRWLDDVAKPNGNSDIAHECVNWDLLMEEFARIYVPPSVFVHPKFGKPWPDIA